MESLVDPAATLASGALVAGYEIAERIGVGGFGEVYRARHTVIGRTAAIKVLHRKYSHDPEAIARFIAEARAASKISHPGIVEVFDFGSLEDGRQFCVMELVAGTTLRELLRDRGRVAVDVALPILRGIAEAIDAAHAAGIAHRDLKPDNVFVLADGTVKVIDFGLAKLVDDTDAPVTQTGSVFGTPIYMSPEQCRGRAIGLATDAYSFGVLAYQMLTGELPFTGEALELALHHLNDPPDPPSRRRAGLPERVDRALLAALAKDPSARPATLGTIVDGIAGTTLLPAITRSGRRNRRRVRFGVLAIAVGAAVITALAVRPVDERPALVAGAGGRPTAVILGFENLRGPDEAWRSIAISEVLGPVLEASDGFLVEHHDEAFTLAVDLGLPHRDGYDPLTLFLIGWHGPARYAITGAFERTGETLWLRLRVQDTATGSTVATAETSGPADRIGDLVIRAGGELRTTVGLGPVVASDASAALAMLPAAHAVETYGEALAAWDINRFGESHGLFERVIAEDAAFPLAHYYRARNFDVWGDASSRDDSIAKARALSRRLPETMRLELDVMADGDATSRHDRKWLETRIAAARALVKLRPGDVHIAVWLARELAAARRLDEATDVVETFKRLPPPVGIDPFIVTAEVEIARQRGDFPAMLAVARRGAEAARAHRARWLLMVFLVYEGQALANIVRPDEATVALTEARQILRVLGVPLVDPLMPLLHVLESTIQYDAARAVLDEIQAMRFATDGPGRRTVLTAMHADDVGHLRLTAEDFVEAEAWCGKALPDYANAGFGSGNPVAKTAVDCVARAQKARRGVVRPTVAAARAAVEAARADRGDALIEALFTLGEALADAGDFAEAEARFDEAATLRDTQGKRRGGGWARYSIAYTALDAGDPAKARRMATRAIEDFRATPGGIGEADAGSVIALADLVEGDLPAAKQQIAKIDDYTRRLEHVGERIRLTVIEAVIVGWSGETADTTRALALAARALADATRTDSFDGICAARYAHAVVLRQAGRIGEANVELAEVERRARAIGWGEMARRAARAEKPGSLFPKVTR